MLFENDDLIRLLRNKGFNSQSISNIINNYGISRLKADTLIHYINDAFDFLSSPYFNYTND